jgi:hypothetical protein
MNLRVIRKNYRAVTMEWRRNELAQMYRDGVAGWM